MSSFAILFNGDFSLFVQNYLQNNISGLLYRGRLCEIFAFLLFFYLYDAFKKFPTNSDKLALLPHSNVGLPVPFRCEVSIF